MQSSDTRYVALTLVRLSYYFGDLSEDQVRQYFYLKDNDLDVEHGRWIAWRQDDLPNGLHSFNGVNFENKQSSLYPRLRYQKAIIDFESRVPE
ncbi:hypothetical protein BDW71DRAFT_49268 [Aspergillus fruticulosus]